MVIKNPFYIALDTSDLGELQRIVEILDDTECGFKVGMEAFYGVGDKALEFLESKNKRVFLDLKLHDIPNTTSRGIFNLAKRYNPEFINIHSSGGFEMMSLTQKILTESRLSTKLLGVTLLTSLDKTDLLKLYPKIDSSEELVLRLASMSKEAGLSGVVSSAGEVKRVKESIDDFITMVPGIRLEGDQASDQKRVFTPQRARGLGSDYLVIGRGITKAVDPRIAYQKYWDNYHA